MEEAVVEGGVKVDFKLYLITDGTLTDGEGFEERLAEKLSAVEKALKAGVKAVQLREKALRGRSLLYAASKLLDITKRYGAKLFINDRLDVALACGADGVHLPQSGFSPRDIRPYWKHGLISVSTHGISEARKAEAAGADFITFGPAFFTPSKARYGDPVGLTPLKDVVETLTIPVFGLGGIKPGNAGMVTGNGAHGIALISGILATDDVESSAREFLNKLY